jgi:hypothetical protein
VRATKRRRRAGSKPFFRNTKRSYETAWDLFPCGFSFSGSAYYAGIKNLLLITNPP